jgi:pantoate--beta-alanine ligase
MKIFSTIEEIRNEIKIQKNLGKKIGFVPTMGALHNGHLSLIDISKNNCDYTVASIFVNPTQFNDPKDLERYPRTLEKDSEMLISVKTDALFVPTVYEIYPEKDTRVFDFGQIDKVMEGKFRPGHFNGVAQVVSKLFSIVEPDKAFFGLKDFQQYVIIKNLAKKYMPELKIEIIGCPIIREKDGLAMSSRNMLLSDEQRKNANHISKVLKIAVENYKNYSVDDLKKFVIDTVNQNNFLKVEYFEIVEDENLTPVESWNDNNKKVGCIAVFCGEIRLIDNIYFN